MVEFRTFGKLQLRAADGRELHTLIAQPKRLALFAYLIAALPHGHQRRDTLVALFWPQLDQERARQALRQALHVVRRSVGSDVIVARGDEEIGVDHSRAWCDAFAFEEAVAAGRAADALELYRGDFLPGFFIDDAPGFERWLDETRARYRALAATAAWALAATAENDGDWSVATDWARRAAGYVPDDEASQRRLITLLDRGGNRAAALQAYDELARRMREDYGVDPSAESQQMVVTIRNRTTPVATGAGPRPPAESIEWAPHNPIERIAASVGGSSSDTTSADATTGPRAARTVPPTSGSRPRLVPVVAIGAILIAVALGAYAVRRLPRDVSGKGAAGASPVRSTNPGATSPAGDRYRASIAVLPFDYLGPDETHRYLGAAISGEIISQLAQIPELKVISRTSAAALTSSGLTLRRIADSLGVGHLLEGSVQRSANRIRITTQLVDASADAPVWSVQYDRTLTDVLDVEREIAREVSGRLVATVAGVRPVSTTSTTSAEAYELYLQATYQRQRRTRDALAKAIEGFERALQIDSGFAPAHAGLAVTLALATFFNYRTVVDPYQALARGRIAAERVIALDSTLAEGWAARGFVGLYAQAPHEKILADLARAVELRPGSAEQRVWYALALSEAGRHDEALAQGEMAVGLDPLAPGVRNALSRVALAAGRHETTLREAAMSRALEPGLAIPSEAEALALHLSGRNAECAERSLGPYAAIRALCLRALGRTDAAAALVDSVERAFTGGDRRVELATALATYHAASGDAPSALQWLERGVEVSPNALNQRVLASQAFAQVRDDRGFTRGLATLRAQVRARTAAVR